MPAEFTGEQQLRIVLESIIRGVPKEEQCKKYGITDEQFQAWHDHLIKNGGKIYEMGPSRASRPTRTRKVKFVPWYVKLLLILSIFSNLSPLRYVDSHCFLIVKFYYVIVGCLSIRRTWVE